MQFVTKNLGFFFFVELQDHFNPLIFSRKRGYCVSDNHMPYWFLKNCVFQSVCSRLVKLPCEILQNLLNISGFVNAKRDKAEFHLLWNDSLQMAANKFLKMLPLFLPVHSVWYLSRVMLTWKFKWVIYSNFKAEYWAEHLMSQFPTPFLLKK